MRSYSITFVRPCWGLLTVFRDGMMVAAAAAAAAAVLVVTTAASILVVVLSLS